MIFDTLEEAAKWIDGQRMDGISYHATLIQDGKYLVTRIGKESARPADGGQTISPASA